MLNGDGSSGYRIMLIGEYATDAVYSNYKEDPGV